MLRSKFWIIFILLVVLSVLFSCGKTGDEPSDVTEPQTQQETDVPSAPADPYAPTSGASFENLPGYVTVSNPERMPCTFEAWVNMKETNGVSLIFGNQKETKTNSFAFLIRDGVPTLTIGIRAESISFYKSEIPCGQWTHVAIAADTEAMKFHCYINGELKESRSMIQGHVNAMEAVEFNSETKTHRTMVGGYFSQSGVVSEPFCGRIGSFAAYSTARTAEEIAADYKNYRDPDTKGLMAAYVFEESGKAVYRDLSRGGIDLSWAGSSYLNEDELTLPENYDYSIMVIGDTQGLTQRSNDSGYFGMYNWLVKNIESKKIQAVIGVGDITDDNIPEQWEKASTAFAGLEGKVKHFPVLGNHDVSTSYGGDDPELFKQYLIFEQDENNGSFDGSMKSYFSRFEIQGQKYLFLGLGYVPSREELDWAKTVLEAHPDHNVILSCHGYLDDDGTPLTHSGAPEIREQLVLPYSNVVLVLCGHMHNENVLLYTEVREDRTTVQALLTNPQEYNYDVNLGIATGLYFTNGGKTVHVANHVAGYDAYLGADSVRTFELDLVHNRVSR